MKSKAPKSKARPESEVIRVPLAALRPELDAPTVISTFAGAGNSVPPLFMRAIAQHVRKEILHV